MTIQVVNANGKVHKADPKNIKALDALLYSYGEMTCGAKSNEKYPWCCTRPVGHKGAHVAHGSEGTYAIFARGAE
jgi:hypothetical protein